MYHIANNTTLREYARKCVANCALLSILSVCIHTRTTIKSEDRKCGKDTQCFRNETIIYENNRVFASDNDTFRSYARQFANTMFFSHTSYLQIVFYTHIYTLYIIIYIQIIDIYLNHRYISKSSIRSLE